jgi:UDPglucose--hexose-1-phosphate uridylyltransferase
MMHKRLLTKRDGRALVLYARVPLPRHVEAPSPSTTPHTANPHLRWHPLRGEWVAYAGHRQQRTFLPPPEYNPLAISRSPEHSTEVPAGPWDVAVFENLFPTLTMSAHDPPELAVPTAAGLGVCEVVVFTQDAQETLGTLPLCHIELLIDVWADRYAELGRLPEVAYVYPFENRGVEVGVTLHHPHGQIYGYPFVPPVPARELEQQRAHYERHGRGLIEDMVAREIADEVRMLYRGSHVAAFMPICARYPYEVWIAPVRPAASFVALTRDERQDFARALKTVLLKFDGLWNTPFPYILAFHQAPTDGAAHPEAHLHAEFYPAYRMGGRLKYLAGSEIGAGVFTADTVPEEKVKELQAVQVNVDA